MLDISGCISHLLGRRPCWCYPAVARTGVITCKRSSPGPVWLPSSVGTMDNRQVNLNPHSHMKSRKPPSFLHLPIISVLSLCLCPCIYFLKIPPKLRETNMTYSPHWISLQEVEDDLEEKAKLISQVLELQNTLEDLSSRVDNVKEENLRLRSENQVSSPLVSHC